MVWASWWLVRLVFGFETGAGEFLTWDIFALTRAAHSSLVLVILTLVSGYPHLTNLSSGELGVIASRGRRKWNENYVISKLYRLQARSKARSSPFLSAHILRPQHRLCLPVLF